MEPRDWRQLPRTDLGVLGTGILAFVFSFLPYYGVTLKFGGIDASESVNAWHGTALVGMLLVVAAAVVAAMVAFAPATLPKTAVSWNFVVLALSVLGAALVVIRSFTLPSAQGPGADVGIRWGAWLLIIACVAQAVFSALRFREKGEHLPWSRAAAPPRTPVSH